MYMYISITRIYTSNYKFFDTSNRTQIIILGHLSTYNTKKHNISSLTFSNFSFLRSAIPESEVEVGIWYVDDGGVSDGDEVVIDSTDGCHE